MTGGKVVILGKIGENFAAGMTGGMAFIYDVKNVLYNFINKDSVIFRKIDTPYWETMLIGLITQHANLTNSGLAKYIIQNWKIQKK